MMIGDSLQNWLCGTKVASCNLRSICVDEVHPGILLTDFIKSILRLLKYPIFRGKYPLQLAQHDTFIVQLTQKPLEHNC